MMLFKYHLLMSYQIVLFHSCQGIYNELASTWINSSNPTSIPTHSLLDALVISHLIETKKLKGVLSNNTYIPFQDATSQWTEIDLFLETNGISLIYIPRICIVWMGNAVYNSSRYFQEPRLSFISFTYPLPPCSCLVNLSCSFFSWIKSC